MRHAKAFSWCRHRWKVRRAAGAAGTTGTNACRPPSKRQSVGASRRWPEERPTVVGTADADVRVGQGLRKRRRLGSSGGLQVVRFTVVGAAFHLVDHLVDILSAELVAHLTAHLAHPAADALG